jgi:adenosine deaminase
MELMDFFHLLPKIELHRHLVGSVRVETLFDIASKYDIPLPTGDLKKLKNLIQIKEPVSDFRRFLNPLKILGLCFYDKKTIARITYEVVEDAAKDNVKYLELAVGPAFEASFHRLSLEEAFEGIIRGVETAEEKYDIKVNLLAGPTFKWRKRKAHSPLQVLEASLQFKERVVGFGLSAETKEGVPFSRWRTELKNEYAKLARKAKDAGFALTVHAGEIGDAQSVMDAIEHLKADRIGHGIKCVKKSDILRYVIERRIPLEICISSNVKSGVVRNLRKHPVRKLYDHGVIVTVNTDDPTLCVTTLTKEYCILVKNFNFSYVEVKKLIFNALSSAFLCEEEKVRLRKTLQKRFDALESSQVCQT